MDGMKLGFRYAHQGYEYAEKHGYGIKGYQRKGLLFMFTFTQEETKMKKTTREEGFPEAILGADQLGMMEGMLMAISLREEECLTYDYPYYYEEQILLDVNGSRGYQGQLLLSDNGWQEVKL